MNRVMEEIEEIERVASGAAMRDREVKRLLIDVGLIADIRGGYLEGLSLGGGYFLRLPTGLVPIPTDYFFMDTSEELADALLSCVAIKNAEDLSSLLELVGLEGFALAYLNRRLDHEFKQNDSCRKE